MIKKYFIALVLLVFVSNLSSTIAQSKKKIVVEDIDKVKLEKFIKNRKGKILLLNIWASWCLPCKREFPDLVKLAEKYKNAPVEIVGLSVDDREDLKTEVIPFLQSNNVNFKIYIQNFRKLDELIEFVPGWEGAIPLTLIYDKKGNQKKFIIGMRNFEFFDQAIQEVLNSSK